MSELTVLVVGSGGREHALALALLRDPGVRTVHVAPGNPATWALAGGRSDWADIDITDGQVVASLALQVGADLVVIGPEGPLVLGVADDVRAAGVACFGPSGAAARLEGSKQFAKEVMAAAGVPTAASRYCTTESETIAALDEFGPPFVVKNDGLAAGKGVVVTSDRAEAMAHAADCGSVVIEEYLDGPEVSLFAICDGTHAVGLQSAQDFKRVADGDEGPNTGGMGAYSPLPWAPDDLVGQVVRQVVDPTLEEMARRNTSFAGLLYVGLALTSRGLRVVEFNVRFGDPETQAVLSLLTAPLGALLLAAATGTLDTVPAPTWDPGAAVCVVLASRGYPGSYETGGAIAGPRLFGSDDDVHIVHAGTSLTPDGRLIATGGRVLGVVAHAGDLATARADAYAAVDALDAPTLFCRRDIAALAADGAIRPAAS